ncbi:MAG: hypothetical protein ACFFC7_23320 [Candidatus Hermodarchaeota archaeon]
MDEPTSGLDSEERVRFRNVLSELSGDRIIILSTHIVSDVETSATDIALISQGRLLRQGTPEELMTIIDGKVWEGIIPSAELMDVKKHKPDQQYYSTEGGSSSANRCRL